MATQESQQVSGRPQLRERSRRGKRHSHLRSIGLLLEVVLLLLHLVLQTVVCFAVSETFVETWQPLMTFLVEQ